MRVVRIQFTVEPATHCFVEHATAVRAGELLAVFDHDTRDAGDGAVRRRPPGRGRDQYTGQCHRRATFHDTAL